MTGVGKSGQDARMIEATVSQRFRSRGWTTLEGPPSASTPNRPLTSNVDHQIPPQHPAPFPLEPAPIQNPPEPWTSEFKPAGVRPQFTSQPAKNHSPRKRAEASCSGWQSINIQSRWIKAVNSTRTIRANVRRPSSGVTSK